MPDIIPAEDLVLRKDIAISHRNALAFIDFLVDIIRDHQIGRLGKICLRTDEGHDGLHGFFVQPIVGIDHLEIKALSCGKASIHRAAMTSVFLMDRTDHIRVLGHKAIADLRSVVLRGTIVNEDDLDIVAQRQQ